MQKPAGTFNELARFVDEAIRPESGTFDVSRMASGEPGLPRAFRWRDQAVRVATVARSWRETGNCRHGSGESYVRRHWYEVVTDAGQIMTIYCDRHARRGDNRRRWWLFSIEDADGRSPAAAP